MSVSTWLRSGGTARGAQPNDLSRVAEDVADVVAFASASFAGVEGRRLPPILATMKREHGALSLRVADQIANRMGSSLVAEAASRNERAPYCFRAP